MASRILLAFIVCSAWSIRADVVTYPAPQDESLSTDYTVEADGKPVPVYRVKSQWHEKKYSMAYFDFSGTVTVKIKTDRSLDHLTILPAKYGIKPTIANGKATFSTDKPFKISFEPTGQDSPLHLFSNPIENDPPKQGDPNVIYFGPGTYKPTRIDLTSGQTLYIAGGAVVKAAVTSKGDNIRIMGRGILDGSDWPHSAGPTARMVWPADGRNILIQDIIIRGAWNWTVAPSRCDQVLVSNLKICGSRCGNDDGIDPCNSSNVTITDCFLHTDDDSIAVKGTARSGQNPKASENIVVSDCTFWVDFANVFRIGAESKATGLRNFTARNIDVIHFPNRDPVSIFYLHPSDNMPMENLLFENIHINGEHPLNWITLTPMLPSAPRRPTTSRPVATTDRVSFAGLGGRAPLIVPGDGPYIHNVAFKNIDVYNPNQGPSPAGGAVFLKGLTAKHDVQNITFENLTLYGQPLKADSPNVRIGDFVSQVRFNNP
ncbi:MAG TPA: glycosyl hydrolase family 28 protein [Tepidisphaeraceae bacterium]|nr:glycosyl hydrolase family 28 protein [Tepidisphaeraceae bacterium]